MRRKETMKPICCHHSSSHLNGITIGLIALCIILFSVLVAILGERQTGTNAPPAPISQAALDVASKFYCPCGSCETLSLDQCKREMVNGGIRALREIESELSQGKEKKQVIKEFHKKHNSIKPEFKYLLES